MDVFLTVMSYIGVIAFAVSGAMVAIRSEADLFGVVFLAVITTFGGGLTRDIILNRYPYPSLFEMKYEFICCIVTALIVFSLHPFSAMHICEESGSWRISIISSIRSVSVRLLSRERSILLRSCA